MQKLRIAMLLVLGVTGLSYGETTVSDILRGVDSKETALAIRAQMVQGADSYTIRDCHWVYGSTFWGECERFPNITMGTLRKYGYTVTIPDCVSGAKVYHIANGPKEVRLQDAILQIQLEELRLAMQNEGDAFVVQDCKWEEFYNSNNYKSCGASALTVGQLKKYGYTVTILDAKFGGNVYQIAGQNDKTAKVSDVKTEALSANIKAIAGSF